MKVQDHALEQAQDSADKAVQELLSVAEEKEEYISHLTRQQRLDELASRVSELTREKRDRENDELAHELIHLQRVVRNVQNNAKGVVGTAKKQAELIQLLKKTRANALKNEQELIKKEAVSIVKMAKVAAQRALPSSQTKTSKKFPFANYKPKRAPSPRIPKDAKI
jgi:vacuolar-type H+-ATPase subunit I/STV1